MCYKVLIAGLSILMFWESVLSTSCSKQSRTSDLSTCLREINQTLYDKDRFWFGTDYFVRCPMGMASGMQCMNHNSQEAQSMWVRLFATSSTKPELDRFLEMRYESIARNYSWCGVTYRATRSDIWWSKDIDPLTSDAEEPWFLRNRPQMSWTYAPDEYYTLLVYDAGYPVVHGIYTNIRGNDLDSAEVIQAYHGSQATQELHNPYIFLLYKHASKLTITQAQVDALVGTGWGASGHELATFVDSLGVGGPVAINWVQVIGDVYGAYLMEQDKALYTCPVFSTKALRDHSRPFLPQNPALTVWLDVQFRTGFLNFSVCCNIHTYSTAVTHLNPIGNPIVSTVMVRTQAAISYSVTKYGVYATRFNFTGELHTLLIVDPDVSNPALGTNERPYLHGMIVNIADGNFSTGNVVRPYIGPAPPDTTAHVYYFLLYKQAGTINTAAMTSYLDATCNTGSGRCLYNINQAVSDQSLQLVGASWLRVKRDAYATKMTLDRDPTQKERMCMGTNGYDDPCPTSGASRDHNRLVLGCYKITAYVLILVFVSLEL